MPQVLGAERRPDAGRVPAAGPGERAGAGAAVGEGGVVSDLGELALSVPEGIFEPVQGLVSVGQNGLGAGRSTQVADWGAVVHQFSGPRLCLWRED